MRIGHDPEDVSDEVIGDLRVKRVAHRIDENGAGCFPVVSVAPRAMLFTWSLPSKR
jgi:hypothetical protein